MGIGYYIRVFFLFLNGTINFESVKFVIRTKPLAVCGKGGSYALVDLHDDAN